MRGIFISYRREDAAGYAGRLYDRLAAQFGPDRVFMDVEGIEPGVDFVDAIESAVGSCEVLIVIIGKDWLAVDGGGKRRLDDSGDFVRIETVAALKRNIRVVPVLVDDATMPRADQLPADLALLARRQAVELSHKHWEATSSELIRTLEKLLNAGKAHAAEIAPPESEPSKPSQAVPPSEAGAERPVVAGSRSHRRYWGIGAGLAVLAGIALFLTQPWNKFTKPVSPSAVHVGAQEPAVTPPVVEAARPADKPRPTVAPPVVEAPRPAEKPPESAQPAPSASLAPKPEPPALPPKILNFETRVADNNVLLCYGVQNGASATITPSPGAVKPVAKECLPVTAGRTYTLTVRNAAGAAVSRSLAVEAAAPPLPAQVQAPVATAPSVPAQSPIASAPPPTPAAAAPSALPRVGDTWEYRFHSIWKNVEPRTYTHQAIAVSEREVRETMSYTSSADKTSESKSFTPDTRFVEWRGKGYYFIEFNPFLQAFGAVQPGTAWKALSVPIEDPFFGNWYSQGRATGWDSVTVPAGTFKAIRVEINSNRPATGSRGMWEKEPVRILHVIWYAADAKRAVKLVRTVFSPAGSRLDEDTYELAKYRVQ